jgi:poly(hydroxyalkanoate) granule-associated protein
MKKPEDPPVNPFNAQEIWLAGLGALSQAQQRGQKAVQELLAQGETLQSQAQQQWGELTQRMANPFSAAAPAVSKLEGIFEQRVAQALHAMGMPNAADVRALQEEVLALNARVAALEGPSPARSTTPSRTAPPAKVAKRAAPAKRAPRANKPKT